MVESIITIIGKKGIDFMRICEFLHNFKLGIKKGHHNL